MASPGIFITQIGVSVPTAADYQYVFNSNWPSIQIIFDTTITNNTGSDMTGITVPHNLGFYPFAQAEFSLLTPTQVFTASSVSVSNRSFPSPILYIGKNNFFVTVQAGSSVNIKAYNIDLTKDTNYTLPAQPVAKTPYDPTTGIKVVKFNKSIQSTDLRDFILHSRAQSPAILSVITDKQGKPDPLGGDAMDLTYTNPAGYVPWIWGFSTSSTAGFSETLTYQAAEFAVQSAAGLSVSGSTMTNRYFTSIGGATLVVLRDPLILSNSVTALYDGSISFTPLIGDFETPVTATFVTDPAGSDWSFTGNAGIATNGSTLGNPTSPVGTQCCFITDTGSLSKTITIPTSGRWFLALDIAAKSTQINPIQFSVDGTTISTFTPIVGSFYTAITGSTFSLTAGNHTFTMAGTAAGNTAFIDALTLSAAP